MVSASRRGQRKRKGRHPRQRGKPLAWTAPISTTRSNALRRSKHLTKTAWIKFWKESPKQEDLQHHALTQTNQAVHRHKPRDIRKAYPVDQCRTGHAYTGEFRRRFFPDENIDCQCGEEFQTHILTNCTGYKSHRKHLKEVSKYIFLPTTLGTEKGIKALSKFIQESGVFTMHGEPCTKSETPKFEDEPEPAEEDSAEELEAEDE